MKNEKLLYCNGCGKRIWMEQGLIREGAVRIRKEWDYFSEKDGEIHSFCLCEKCYDRMREKFVIPVETESVREYF